MLATTLRQRPLYFYLRLLRLPYNPFPTVGDDVGCTETNIGKFMYLPLISLQRGHASDIFSLACFSGNATPIFPQTYYSFNIIF